jgi:glutamate dehydrogenase
MGSEVRADVIGRVIAHASRRLTSEQLLLLTPFVQCYYARIHPADLASRQVPDLYGAAMDHLGFGRERRPGEVRLRTYAPDQDRYGYVSPHSIVELVVEDMPFLVDTMTMEISRHGFGLHLVVHPVITVRRDKEGRLVEVLKTEHDHEHDDDVEHSHDHTHAADDLAGTTRESFMHIEIDRETDPATLDELRRHGRRAGLAGDEGPGARDRRFPPCRSGRVDRGGRPRRTRAWARRGHPHRR